jgi:adenylate kinase family enzyme
MGGEAKVPVVVVTGLAGAGKSTLAGPLADALGVPLLSKDILLEALHGAVAIAPSAAWRETLSRTSDAALVAMAAALDDGAVLDNFWRKETARELLAPITSSFVEVYCRVEPAVAVSRWFSRERAPIHRDDERSRERDEALRVMQKRASMLPIGFLGPVVEVDTSKEVDVDNIAAMVRHEAVGCRRMNSPASFPDAGHPADV